MTISDATVTIIKATAIPFLTIATSVILFWLKFYWDSRKRLDDLLIDLEHAIYRSDNRQRVFSDRYLEVRKAITDLDRWIVDPVKKRKLKEAFARFRGQKFTTASIFDLKGGPHEAMIDVFLTGAEVRVLAPDQRDFTEYLLRIAELRKITGSRKWADGELKVV